MATDTMKEAEKVEEALRHPTPETSQPPFPPASERAPLQGETISRRHVPGSPMQPSPVDRTSYKRSE